MKILKNAYYFTAGYNKENKIYFSKTLVLTDLSILKQLLQYKKKLYREIKDYLTYYKEDGLKTVNHPKV